MSLRFAFLAPEGSSSSSRSFQSTETASSSNMRAQLDQLKRTISGNPKTLSKFLLSQLTVLGSKTQ